MIVPRYVPGDWFAAVTDGRVLLLPGCTAADRLTRLWSSLRDHDLGEQLQLLMADGLAGLPPFALVSVEAGRVHAVVRGDVTVEVDAEEGSRVLTGADVMTWTEAVVPGARAVAVRAGGARGDAAGGQDALPVLSAVVPASVVLVTLHQQVPVDAPRRRDRRPTEPEVVPDEPVVQEVTGVADVPEVTDVADVPEAEVRPVRGPVPTPRTSSDVPVLVPAGSQVPDDHDGLTVLSSDVVALRRQLPDWAGDVVPGPLAVPAPEAPAPAKLHLSSGLVISLNRPVLLGRAPQVSRVANDRLPRLVTVASPNQDISRTHAEVRQEGEHVLVTDLRSTNGVLLMRQGSGPQRLHPGEPTVVEPGVVVDLGEGVTFVVERGT